MNYQKDYVNGLKLFDKVKQYGGELKLISYDNLQVDVKIKVQFGFLGMAVKFSTVKRYGRCYIRTEEYIINYLAQFKEREC